MRVIVLLAMHDSPPLVSGALRLLFRHFSQRQEVLKAFKQVQLLVSDSDVESYKQIKTDLDALRLIVEKSELWVYKKIKMAETESSVEASAAPIEAKTEEKIQLSPRLDESQARNYSEIQQILIRMKRMSVHQISSAAAAAAAAIAAASVSSANMVFRPRKHEQHLLRNMGVQTVVLDLLQIPYDKKEDLRMKELMQLAHEFLQNFCRGNQANQCLLHKHLDLFLTPGLTEAQTCCAIFQDNSQLCGEVSDKVVQHFVRCIDTHGCHVEYLNFLQTIVKSDGKFIRKCQDMIMQEASLIYCHEFAPKF